MSRILSPRRRRPTRVVLVGRRSLHLGSVRWWLGTSAGSLLISRVVVPILGTMSVLTRTSMGIIGRWWSSVGLICMSSLPRVLSRRNLRGITLVVLAVIITVASRLVLVVLALLLVHIVTVTVVASILLLRVSVSLIVRLGIIVVLRLLRGISAIGLLHGSLVVLRIVRPPGRLVGRRLIVCHVWWAE